MRSFAPLKMTGGCLPERSEGSPKARVLGMKSFGYASAPLRMTGGVGALHNYYVYIMTNMFGNVMYIGVTNDLTRRVYEHKHKLLKGFTSKYNITKLVYYEHSNNIEGAIIREKQLKGWLRKKKNALVETMNPEWKDLSETLSS